MMLRRWCLAAAAALGVAAPAVAGATELRIGAATYPLSVDPHFYNGIADRNLSLHLYGRLVEQTGDMKLIPGLASAWKLVSETEWEFTLRPDVTWSDGKPFTSEDVAFSLTRSANIPNSPLGYAVFTRDIARIDTPDAHTVRIVTKAPSPNLPLNIFAISIVAKHAATGAGEAEFNAGPAAVGTGPYRLVRFLRNERVDMERNPHWRGPAPDWDTVSFRFIGNEGARSAALLSGDVDLIENPARADLPRLRGDARFRLASAPGNRTLMLLPNVIQEGPSDQVTDNAGKPLPRNPLRDLRVRQALSHAIDRKSLAERVMEDTAVPAGQFMWPGAFSYTPDIGVPAHDPARARALLAEAGFPEGFRIVLSAYGDRPDFRALSQAVAQMWTRIGVKTTINTAPASVYLGRGAKHEYMMPFFSWGVSTGEASYVLNNIYRSKDAAIGTGSANWGGYANPALDTLIDRANATMDDAARGRLLIEAQKIVADDVAGMPLVRLVNYWATRSGVIYEARPDQRTVAASARLAAP